MCSNHYISNMITRWKVVSDCNSQIATWRHNRKLNATNVKLISNFTLADRGATTAGKLRGTKVWVPKPGCLRPAPGQRPSWGGGGRGSLPSAVGVRGCHPRHIFENSDAQSCILVASALISGLPRTCISEQTTSMSKAKSVPIFQLFSRGCASGC